MRFCPPDNVSRREVALAQCPRLDDLPLFIQLLGGLAIFSYGQQCKPPRRTKSHQLLAYLLLRADGAEVRRSELVSALWPDEPSVRARSRLRLCLHDLGSSLPHHPDGGEWTVRAASSVKWKSNAREHCCVDVWELRQMDDEISISGEGGSPGYIETLLERLRAFDEPLLPSHDGEWIASQRATVEDTYVSVALRLVDEVVATGSTGRAIVDLQRLVARDSSDGRVHQLLTQLRNSRSDGQLVTGDLVSRVTVLLKARLDPPYVAESLAFAVRRTPTLFRRVAPPLLDLPLDSLLTSGTGHYVDMESRLTSLHDSITGSRVVAITGACGSGKSRCMGEYATATQASWIRKGVELIFIDLDHPTCCVPSLGEDAGDASTSAVRESSWDHRDVGNIAGSQLHFYGTALAESSRGKSVIMYLDNVDANMARVLLLISVLAGASDNIRIVYTSQLPLGIAGEQVWQVPPIAMGGEYALLSSSGISETLQLFTAYGGFLPLDDPGRRAAIRDIELLVDGAHGLPLAAVLLAIASRQIRRWSRTALEELIWGRRHCPDPEDHERSSDWVTPLEVPERMLAERHKSLTMANNISAKRSSNWCHAPDMRTSDVEE